MLLWIGIKPVDMPELPDLQAFSKNLDKRLSGKKVEKINAVVTKKLNVKAAVLASSLEGATLKEVVREGKTLQFLFSNKAVLGLHLMLNGELWLDEHLENRKGAIIEITFTDGWIFTMTDYQGMAAATLNPQPTGVPDAMSEEADEQFYLTLLASKRSAVKNILLDQKSVQGIGNAYADEILWDCRISPFSVANKIPEKAVRALSKSVRKVLTDAEQHILKTNPSIISGEERGFLKIHGAKIKESPGGAEVQVKRMGARKTYFTDEQVLYS